MKCSNATRVYHCQPPCIKMTMAKGKVGAIFGVDEAVFTWAARFLVANPFCSEGFDVIVVQNVCGFDISSPGRLGKVRIYILSEGRICTFVFFTFFFLHPSSTDDNKFSSPSESFSFPHFSRLKFSKHITDFEGEPTFINEHSSCTYTLHSESLLLPTHSNMFKWSSSKATRSGDGEMQATVKWIS